MLGKPMQPDCGKIPVRGSAGSCCRRRRELLGTKPAAQPSYLSHWLPKFQEMLSVVFQTCCQKLRVSGTQNMCDQADLWLIAGQKASFWLVSSV